MEKLFSLEVVLPLTGHHETPLSASTKMLERFPNNLPKHRENVIPADSEKKSFEEVSGEVDSQLVAPRVRCWGLRHLSCLYKFTYVIYLFIFGCLGSSLLCTAFL